MKCYILLLFIAQLVSATAIAQTTTFSYSAPGGVQTWTAASTGNVLVNMSGGQGGYSYTSLGTLITNAGGLGGKVVCILPVTSGQVLDIYVAGQGQTQTTAAAAAGGFTGGGAGGAGTANAGGGGGGASYIAISGTDVVIAGGGGGGAYYGTASDYGKGGAGGGLTGGAGNFDNSASDVNSAGGGTQSGGGAGPNGGNSGSEEFGGGNAKTGGPGGGGGGGYWGGGGGGSGGGASGGGGGSSYTLSSITAVTHTQGYNAGNGYVAITFYGFINGSAQNLSVCKNSSAASINSLLTLFDGINGLTDTWSVESGPSNGSLSGFPITGTSSGSAITPSGLTYTPTTGYSGTDVFTISVTNGTHISSTTINVTVGPTVSISTTPAAICQGHTTAALGGSFGGTATAATWSASPAVGSFANNGGSTPGTATYTATSGSTSPVTLMLTTNSGSCDPSYTTFTTTSLIVNANPTVSISATPAAICQGGTTAGLGGSFGGGAAAAVWTASPTGGSFANNVGSTPNTATYTASYSATSPVTLTLTTSGGSCSTTFTTTSLTVNPGYAITSSAGTHGSISPSGTTSVCSGGSQEYTIAANSGYYISSVLVDGSGVGAVSSYTFSSVSAAHTIGASFTLNTAPIFTGSSPQSLAVCKNSGAADISSLLQITDPDAGQTETFSVTSGPSHGTITTGTTIASGTGVSPTGWSYTPATSYTGSDAFTMQVADGAGGTASTVINVTVNPLPTVSISGTPAAICQGGTTSAGLGGSVGGDATGGTWSDIGAGGTFSSTTDLNATYTASSGSSSPVTLMLTTTGGSCGSIFAFKSLVVNANPTVSISATPAAICQGGTTAAGLGGSVGGGATGGTWSDGSAGGTFSSATALNATYTASPSSSSPVTLTLTTTGGSCGTTFTTTSLTVNPRYAITTSAVSNGSISPSGTTNVCQGSGQAYTITANSGYYITSVLVDGGSVGAVSSYTFSSVSATHTISATFALSNVAPTFTASSPQSLTVCENSGATSINSLLQITDPDAGQTETFSVTSSPSHGTITTGTTATSGGTASPTGWSYTPTAGYNGSDAFTVQVSDGAGGTASTTINVTVNGPIVTVSGAPAAICQGGTTATGLGGSVSGGGTTSGLWSDGGAGGTFNTSATMLNATYTASATAPSTVTLTLTSTGGTCTGSSSISLTVNPNYTITTSSVSNGSISPAGTTNVCQGGSQAYTIAANSGYYISDVSADGSSVGAVLSYTFSSVSATHTIGASFTLNTAPTFTGGSPQSSAVCKNSGAACINPLLQVTDPDPGQTETFTVTSGASHGSVATGTTVASGTAVSPTGWSYTPTSGYSGSDAFTIQVSDGTGGTASTIINVMVNAPTVSIGSTPAPICQGGTTAAGLGGSVGGGATGGSWTDGGSGGTFSPSATTLNATYTASASFVSPVMLTLTTTGGSCGTISTSRSLIVIHNPTVTISGTPAAICQGGTTATGLGGSVTGGGATGGTWSDGGAGGTFNPGPTTLNATYTASSSSSSPVTLTLTGIATCPVSHAISLTVNPSPTTVGVISGPSPANVNNGATITLTDAPSGGTWSSANTAIASVISTTGVVTGGATGGGNTIYYTVSNSCGTAKASYVIHVYSSICNCY